MAGGKRVANLVCVLVLGCSGCVGPEKSHSGPPKPDFLKGSSASASSSWAKPVTSFATSAKRTVQRGAESLSDRLNLKSDFHQTEQVAQTVSPDDPTSLAYQPGPLGTNLYVAAAGLAERQGRVDNARKQYQRALQVDGRDRAALIGLARLQHRSGDMKGAISTYQRALAAYRDDPIIMNDLGLCHARNGQLDQGISLLRSAVARQPDRQMYRNNLAAALVEANRPEEAFAYLSQGNNPAIAHYNVGYLLHRSGHAGQAADHFSKSLALDPSLHQAQAMLNQIAPQVSALPPSSGSQSTVPNTSAGAVKMPDPRDWPKPSGEAPAATIPRGTPPHLQTPPRRVGPFGYVPPSGNHRVVQVSYDTDDAGSGNIADDRFGVRRSRFTADTDADFCLCAEPRYHGTAISG